MDTKKIIQSLAKGDYNAAKQQTSDVLFQKAGHQLEISKEQIRTKFTQDEADIIHTDGEEPTE